MELWDDEDFEPTAPTMSYSVPDKWDGEDEEENVKESWDDEDQLVTNKVIPQAVQQKSKKKPLAKRIAEIEKQEKEEMAKRLIEEKEEISPEERLRRQKAADLELALETTFADGNKENSKIGDLVLPNSKIEFNTFTDALSKKLTPLSGSVEYPNFVVTLTRNLCATMTSLDIRHIKSTLDTLYLEKQKLEKANKTKKGKAKGKASLSMGGDDKRSLLSAYMTDYDEFDGFDDFM